MVHPADAEAAGGDKPKKEKGEKDPKQAWPLTAVQKVKKTTLEAALAACFRLENSKKMGVNIRAGFALTVSLQLMTLLFQCLVATIFNATTAEAAEATYAPGNVALLIGSIRSAINSAHGRPWKPMRELNPMDLRTCSMQRAHPWLGYLMMFLWFSMMVKHIFDTLELVAMVATLPTLKPKKEKDPSAVKEPKVVEDPDHMADKMGKEKDKLDHMQFQWKLFALVFILLPHLALAFYMTYVGMKFLASTGDPGTLIMKAMALKFVLMFDKLFYSAFLSEQLQNYVRKTKYSVARAPERNYWHSWLVTVFKLMFVLFLTGCAWSSYTHMLKLRMHCRLYFEHSASDCLGNSCGMSFSF